MRPFPTTAKRTYPSGLTPPDYATSGWPDEEFGSRYQSTIEVKTQRAREGMRAACSLARHVMDVVAGPSSRATTEELDRICHAVTVGNGAYPSPLNYMGFPKSLCTSVNEVVCHGIPDSRPLREGDARQSGHHRSSQRVPRRFERNILRRQGWGRVEDGAKAHGLHASCARQGDRALQTGTTVQRLGRDHRRRGAREDTPASRIFAGTASVSSSTARRTCRTTRKIKRSVS